MIEIYACHTCAVYPRILSHQFLPKYAIKKDCLVHRVWIFDQRNWHALDLNEVEWSCKIDLWESVPLVSGILMTGDITCSQVPTYT